MPKKPRPKGSTKPAKSAQSSGGSAGKPSEPKAPRGRPFPKGVSGNPGGRPKSLREVQAYAMTFSRDAVDKLVSIMKGRSLKEARQAAVALLDRACGKPAQPIVGDDDADAIRVEGADTLIDLLRRLAGEKPEDT